MEKIIYSYSIIFIIFRIYEIFNQFNKKNQLIYKEIEEATQNKDLDRIILLSNSIPKTTIYIGILNIIWILLLILKTSLFYYGMILFIMIIINYFISTNKITNVIQSIVAITIGFIILYLGLIKELCQF